MTEKQLLILVFQFRKRKRLQLERKEPRGDFSREVFMHLVLYPITNITHNLPDLQGERKVLKLNALKIINHLLLLYMAKFKKQ